MIRIVVADDEDVRDIIADFIENACGDSYEVIGRAENGEQALELVRCMRPDILVTDICMPGMDGLKLIRELNGLSFKVRTLIISGYDEFAYAKTAIGLGVADYLLKPFSPDELQAALDKMKQEIGQQNLFEQSLLQLENELERKHRYQKEEFLRELLAGAVKNEMVPQQGREVGVELEADYYCVCCVECFVEKEGDFTLEQEFSQLFEQVQPFYFETQLHAYLTLDGQREIVILFAGSGRDEAAFQRSITAGLGRLAESMLAYYNLQMRCYVGGIHYDWRMFARSWQEAKTAWRGTLDHSRPVTFYAEYEKAGVGQERGFNRPTELENALLIHIQMDRRQEALDTVEKIIRYYEAYPLVMQDFVGLSLVELVLAVARSLKEAGSGYNPWEDEELAGYMATHFQRTTLARANDALRAFVLKSCQEFARFNEKQGDKIVAAVKNLVEKNIANEDFSLETISAELYFSIPYIRQVFKQKEGEVISEYLIRRRMETARELLEQPDAKVADVAEKTGYNNQRYFATAFKKYCGCTPTEYRREHARSLEK